MANATKDVDTQYRENFDYQFSAAAGQKFFKGTMTGISNTGLAGNLSATFPRVVGVFYQNIDQTGGVNSTPATTLGNERIQVRRGCHRFAQDASITPLNVGQVARAIDDQTVTLAGGIAPAGIIQRVETDGSVWVSFDIARGPLAGGGYI
jgi:hypothetical protein